MEPTLNPSTSNDALRHSYGPEVALNQQPRSPQYEPESHGPELSPKQDAWKELKTDGTASGEKPLPPDPEIGNVEIQQAIMHGGPRPKRILGIKVTYCIGVLVTIMILSLGLGLGLGFGLENKSNKSSKAKPSPTSPSSTSSSSAPSSSPTAVTSGTHGLAENSCTFETPRTYESKVGGAKFTQYCFTDWPRNGDSADGDGEVHDLNTITTYTFEDCMDECAKINEKGNGPPLCQAISYNANLTASVEQGPDKANCYLKTKKGVNHQGTAESACAALVF